MTTTTNNLTKATEVDSILAQSRPMSWTVDGREHGHCFLCRRSGFKLNQKTGGLSRHGFQRPRHWGMQVGGCMGAGRTPAQTHKLAQERAREEIEQLASMLQNSDELLATWRSAYLGAKRADRAKERRNGLRRRRRSAVDAGHRAAALRRSRAGALEIPNRYSEGTTETLLGMFRKQVERALGETQRELADLELYQG